MIFLILFLGLIDNSFYLRYNILSFTRAFHRAGTQAIPLMPLVLSSALSEKANKKANTKNLS